MGWSVLLLAPLLGKGRVLRWQSWGRKEQTWEAGLASQLPECHATSSHSLDPHLPPKLKRAGTNCGHHPTPENPALATGRKSGALSLPFPLNTQGILCCYWCKSKMGMLRPGSSTETKMVFQGQGRLSSDLEAQRAWSTSAQHTMKPSQNQTI